MRKQIYLDLEDARRLFRFRQDGLVALPQRGPGSFALQIQCFRIFHSSGQRLRGKILMFNIISSSRSLGRRGDRKQQPNEREIWRWPDSFYRQPPIPLRRVRSSETWFAVSESALHELWRKDNVRSVTPCAGHCPAPGLRRSCGWGRLVGQSTRP